MIYNTSAFSFPGRKKENQDSYTSFALDGDHHVICIADGVGGRKGGAEASMLAITEVKHVFSENLFTTMVDLFDRVHHKVLKQSKDLKLPEMSTTLTVVYVNKDDVTIGHVGDCRLYHLRGRGIVTKTYDQSEKQKLIDDGVLSRERALYYHRKNILLSVIAPDKQYELYEAKFKVVIKDRLLLVSDGVYNICTKKELSMLSEKVLTVSQWLGSISSLIKGREFKDDYTAVALEFL